MSGTLFVVAAPSGAGKTSLVAALVESMSGIEVSISHTTRPARPGEKDTVNYFFVDKDVFEDLINQNAFLEYAKVFGKEYYYGTSIRWVKEKLEAGIDVILEIDWQGAEQAKKAFKDTVSIFILPPSREELKNRLTARRQDDDAAIADRMATAGGELSHYHEFDYLIVNDDFDQAVQDLQCLVLSKRLTRHRQVLQIKPLLDDLGLVIPA